MDAATEVQILCRNAQRAVIACGSIKDAGMWPMSQNIIPYEKFMTLMTVQVINYYYYY